MKLHWVQLVTQVTGTSTVTGALWVLCAMRALSIDEAKFLPLIDRGGAIAWAYEPLCLQMVHLENLAPLIFAKHLQHCQSPI